MLESNFEVKKVMKNGALSYIQVYPKNPGGKELFIYNEDNIDRQYVPIDDERTSVFSTQSLNDAEERGVDVDTFLLETLGEPIVEYFVANTDDGVFYYDRLEDLMEEYDVDLPIEAVRGVISYGASIDTLEGITIYDAELTKMQFDAMDEVL